MPQPLILASGRGSLARTTSVARTTQPSPAVACGSISVVSGAAAEGAFSTSAAETGGLTDRVAVARLVSSAARVAISTTVVAPQSTALAACRPRVTSLV